MPSAFISVFSPEDIPPLNPPAALFITSPVTLIFTFSFATIFPLILVTLSPLMSIFPPAFNVEPIPPPLSSSAIFNLVSFPKYTCGTKTFSPPISTSTYHTMSFSNLLICSGVKALPTSNPKFFSTLTALSSISFILSEVISPV